MPRSEWLEPEGRNHRRSIADAIDVLHKHAAFDGGCTVEIRIRRLQLLSRDVVGLVAVFAENTTAETTFVVTLRTCKKFRAERHDSREMEEFDIFRLDGATVDGSGNVELVDGTQLCAVDVIPALLPYHVTDLEWRILHYTIAMMKAERECYTYPIRFARPCDALDCSTLPSLEGRVSLLKQIQAYIAAQEPGLEGLSLQKIADTLHKFGVRIPRRRLRAPSDQRP
ncbi:hypothetical protein I6F18_08280 [Bradyrhizobium sp. NBAIM32]|uniref:hypothetical protein n=1 Tax=Bradyrhizobium sp. NBAIM32 TaxID=2793809 RepID=UPI001CD41879|nr:hypothetical protein [Bradyrhizobium sp. NBAIM32]MCA1539950.1 hypothetical protein [Bradyrhizobium sp. NBAIM32]